jgi:hypothetical protein
LGIGAHIVQIQIARENKGRYHEVVEALPRARRSRRLSCIRSGERPFIHGQEECSFLAAHAAFGGGGAVQPKMGLEPIHLSQIPGFFGSFNAVIQFLNPGREIIGRWFPADRRCDEDQCFNVLWVIEGIVKSDAPPSELPINTTLSASMLSITTDRSVTCEKLSGAYTVSPNPRRS